MTLSHAPDALRGSLYWRGCYRADRALATPESNAHPAKMDWTLCERILAHLEDLGLLRPDDTVFDFMAGTGRTALVAGAQGYRTMTLELEPRFIVMQRENKTYAEKRLGRTLDWTILEGDARRLTELLQERGLCGVVSPPYIEGGDVHSVDPTTEGIGRKDGKHRGDSMAATHQAYASPGQIGAMPDRGIVGVTSPPYDAPGHPSLGSTLNDDWGHDGRGIARRRGLTGDYGVTEGQVQENYLQAMLQAYRQAAQVCRVLVVVTKNPTRNGKLRLLHRDTARLLRASGFRIVDYHRALLWEEQETATLFGDAHKRPRGRMSFFKRLSYQKGAPVARWEDVLFCVREGDGFAGIVSPPYADAQSGGGISAAMRGEGKYKVTTSMPGSVYQPAEHGSTPGQIGNLKAAPMLATPPGE